MNDSIKSGDMVWAVRDCCGHWLGRPFTVGNVLKAHITECPNCNARAGEIYIATNKDWISGRGLIYCLPVLWLRKIQPPGELTDSKTEAQQPKENVPCLITL